MGSDDAVGRAEQGIGTEDRFAGHHIHSRALNFAAAQCIVQRLFVNQRAPGRVENHDTVFHFGDGFPANDALRFGEQGTMEGNDVRVCQQCIQIDNFGNSGGIFPTAAAGGKDLHAQGVSNGSNSPADAAVADDTKGFPGQLCLGCAPEAEIRAFFPFAFMNQVAMIADSVAKFQKQRNGELGYGSSAVTGHIANRDIPLSGGCAVHIVVAGGADADQLDIGAGIQDTLGDDCFVGDDDLCITDAFDGLFRSDSLIIDDRFTQAGNRFPTQIAGIQSLSVQNYDFHMDSSGFKCLCLKKRDFFDRIWEMMWGFNMELLYVDADIVVCLKPARVLSTDEPGGVPDLVREALGDPNADVRTVHRLDRVVAGLMVLARNANAASELSRQIRDGEFEKEYMAVIHGCPEEQAGTLRDLLGRDKARKMTFVAAEPAKGVQEAVLDYRLLNSARDMSRVRIRLHTGRTHQIRVQFASRGMPLVGERKYNTLEDPCEIALWSYRLGFTHPKTGKRVEFTHEPPRIYPWNVV